VWIDFLERSAEPRRKIVACATLGSKIMKRRVGLVCATFTLLAFPALACAEDAAGAPAASAAPAGSDLEAGGLKPPAAVPGNPDANATSASPDAALDRADKEDSGRGLEFVWLNADVGAEFLGLQTFKSNQLVDGAFVDSKHAGAVYGAGLGVRLLVFTFGARFRFGDFADWQLWTLNAEAGLRIPLGRIEPYFTLGGGYASLGAFSGSELAARLKSADVHATGFDTRAGFGVDVYLTNTFSVGGNLTGDVLFLSRSASSSFEVPQPPGQAPSVYANHGSGIGAGATLSAVLGLHF
jgi:hypothetical protein